MNQQREELTQAVLKLAAQLYPQMRLNGYTHFGKGPTGGYRVGLLYDKLCLHYSEDRPCGKDEQWAIVESSDPFFSAAAKPMLKMDIKTLIILANLLLDCQEALLKLPSADDLQDLTKRVKGALR